MKLHLGASDVHKPGYLNVDIGRRPDWATSENWMRVDLRNGATWSDGQGGWKAFRDERTGEFAWPWATSSIDEIVAHDVFEHIDQLPAYSGNAGMIWTFNESWRVLKPGGILDLVVPCLPGSAPFVDMTHKVVYHSDNAFYFTKRWNHPKGERGRLGPDYGIRCLWDTVGGRSFKPDAGPDESEWTAVNYAPGTDRHKLFLKLEVVK